MQKYLRSIIFSICIIFKGTLVIFSVTLNITNNIESSLTWWKSNTFTCKLLSEKFKSLKKANKIYQIKALSIRENMKLSFPLSNGTILQFPLAYSFFPPVCCTLHALFIIMKTLPTRVCCIIHASCLFLAKKRTLPTYLCVVCLMPHIPLHVFNNEGLFFLALQTVLFQ